MSKTPDQKVGKAQCPTLGASSGWTEKVGWIYPAWSSFAT
jgi:hypothetical protein